MAVVTLGGGRRLPTDKIDFAVGFDRLAGLGTPVRGRTVIARIHARTEDSAREAEERLRRAYEIGAQKPIFPLLAAQIAAPETM